MCQRGRYILGQLRSVTSTASLNNFNNTLPSVTVRPYSLPAILTRLSGVPSSVCVGIDCLLLNPLMLGNSYPGTWIALTSPARKIVPLSRGLLCKVYPRCMLAWLVLPARSGGTGGRISRKRTARSGAVWRSERALQRHA